MSKAHALDFAPAISSGQGVSYWLCIFTPESLQLGLKSGFNCVAFPSSRIASASKIRPGDLVFIYVTRVKAFAGYFRVIKKCHIDPQNSTFGPPGRFPVVLPVEAILLSGASSTATLDSIGNRLPLLRGISNRKNWPCALRISPRQLSRRDAEVIVSAISDE